MPSDFKAGVDIQMKEERVKNILVNRTERRTAAMEGGLINAPPCRLTIEVLKCSGGAGVESECHLHIARIVSNGRSLAPPRGYFLYKAL